VLNSYREDEPVLVAVDCIIFGFDGRQLKALLIKRAFDPEKDKWSLMGGFVGKDENADEAAVRVLHQLTGLNDIYMESFYTFSEVDRDTSGRVISIAYFALINITGNSDQVQQEHEARWFPINEIPALIFDHDKMVLTAREQLRQKVAICPIGFELLPQKFTLRQLRSLYEAILETSLDQRNFSKRMLSLGVLAKLDEKEKGSSRKGAFYYVFDSVRYRELSNTGLRFI
jgi:ADP-ribose pyrophosphatase YjhB (NUDIX family)